MKVLTVTLANNGLNYTATVEDCQGLPGEPIPPYTSPTAHGALFGIAHHVRQHVEADAPQQYDEERARARPLTPSPGVRQR